ncbi:HNH endonuclease signature motif containing protein [Lapidilactobacillus luobeiensis]|uniref:HNH endonuclease signature motif containing protein n=1 Tax=Lapidilactobacillus luobeiensis TaxID=2950371 RepID=UPI0021C3A02D|nr:HNH endonuclease [Lapidilactobacillus luobeiensis]
MDHLFGKALMTESVEKSKGNALRPEFNVLKEKGEGTSTKLGNKLENNAEHLVEQDLSKADIGKNKSDIGNSNANIESLKTNAELPETNTESLGRLPKSDGFWEGERGNSGWKPDLEKIPSDKNGTNPERLTWKKILNQHGIDKINFKDGEPDFSEISKGEVKIDDYTGDRADNFDQADEKLAKERGCTPEEVQKWRHENKYTWHECRDCQTMQKVPTVVHGNIPHSGGISAYKHNQANNSEKV